MSACTEAEFHAARAAGLLVVTTADEAAIHAYAEAIRRHERQALGSLLAEEAADMRRTGDGCTDGRYEWMAAGVDAVADTLRGIDSATGMPATPALIAALLQGSAA
jgi:hypothetical protein